MEHNNTKLTKNRDNNKTLANLNVTKKYLYGRFLQDPRGANVQEAFQIIS